MTKLTIRALTLILFIATAALASGQAWVEAYDKALSTAKAAEALEAAPPAANPTPEGAPAAAQLWAVARTAFQEAIALRPDDQSNPTSLPGPVTEPRIWRGGSPYSPNFGAAYAAYRQALVTKDEPTRAALLKLSATEFESLLSKNQNSPLTYYFLNQIYTAQNDVENQRNLETRLRDVGVNDWKVDTSFIRPEELAAVNQAVRGAGSGQTQTPVIIAGRDPIPGTNTAPGQQQTPLTPGLAGRVPTLPFKYALIVGNSESSLPNGKQEFAAGDAMMMRDALVQYAGYDERNIEVVTNATAEQIRSTMKALAERMPDEGVIFIFFSGVGVNVGGKDYWAGIDTELATDTSTMLPVEEVYRTFLAKATSIFMFNQANRPVVNGFFFGAEEPMLGRIAVAHGTIPDQQVFGIMRGSRMSGLYASAMVEVLKQFRSNQVPVTEFGWQVFTQMRRGNTGTTGGGSRQTCTIPTTTNLASDARF